MPNDVPPPALKLHAHPQLHPLTLDQVLKLATVLVYRLELVATGTLPAKQYGTGAGECRCKTGMTTLVAE
jgi:hypothetical protein